MIDDLMKGLKEALKDLGAPEEMTEGFANDLKKLVESKMAASMKPVSRPRGDVLSAVARMLDEVEATGLHYKAMLAAAGDCENLTAEQLEAVSNSTFDEGHIAAATFASTLYPVFIDIVDDFLSHGVRPVHVHNVIEKAMDELIRDGTFHAAIAKAFNGLVKEMLDGVKRGG